MIRAFIQARMSSRRFPGKVLAPLAGRPVIAHVVARTAQVMPLDRITVLTSTEPSDDPLAGYVRELGVTVYRGVLHDVVARFQACLRAYSCNWFFRVCADSPLLESAVLQRMVAYTNQSDVDLITNVYPRTFPKGQSAELLNAATFAAIDSEALTAAEREHVTTVFYKQPQAFRIVNVESQTSGLAETSLAVDTVDDLSRLELAWQSGSLLLHGTAGEARL